MTSKRTYIARSVTLAAVLVVFAAAVSAGIHAGLVPEHLTEMPLLGISFILAVVALIGVGAAVALRLDQLPASLAALLFGALILAYVASRTTGLPVLEPDPEAVDAIGVVTVAVQLVGVMAALWLTRNAARRRAVEDDEVPSSPVPHRLGTLSLAGLVAIGFTVLALNGVGSGEGHEHGHPEGHHHDGVPALNESMPGME